MGASNQRELLILRHAKSDRGSGPESDFDRPLTNRGNKQAAAVGKWMKQQKLLPDYIVSSPAKRAKLTAYAVAEKLGMAQQDIHFDDTIYMAGIQSLLRVLTLCPENAQTVMIVGHNPGLDDLLQYLVDNPPLTETGKLMTTASLARVFLPKDWSHLERHCGKLIDINRPRDTELSNC